jgi:hypothetical protein
VTIDWVRTGEWIYWTLIHNDSELQTSAALSLVYTLYKSLHAKFSPACSVFNSRFLVTDINNGDSSVFRAQILPSRYQYRTTCQQSTDLVARVLFFITPRRGHRRQHTVSSRNRCRGNVFAESLPRNRPNITAHVTIITYQRLLSLCFFWDPCLAVGLYATRRNRMLRLIMFTTAETVLLNL